MKKISLRNCPFCPSKRIFAQFTESKHFVAIHSIAPILPGHSLIIPKWHTESIMELSDAELTEMTIFARNVVGILLQAFNSKAFDWTIQEGNEAGQTVSHLHLHLIPREPDDLEHPGDWYPLLQKNESEIIDSESRNKLTPTEMEKIVTHIKNIARTLKSSK